GASPRDVHLADLNGDGLDDVVVVNAVASGTLTVLRNTTVFKPAGQGPEAIALASSVSYPTLGKNPTSVALGDTNQDRMLDAAVTTSASDAFAVIPGVTPGPFRTATDPAWIQAVYLDLFHRPADSGAAGWLAGLPNASLVTLIGPAGSASPLAITALDSRT